MGTRSGHVLSPLRRPLFGGPKVFTFYVKPVQSFYVLRKIFGKFLRSVENRLPRAALPALAAFLALAPLPAAAWSETSRSAVQPYIASRVAASMLSSMVLAG